MSHLSMKIKLLDFLGKVHGICQIPSTSSQAASLDKIENECKSLIQQLKDDDSSQNLTIKELIHRSHETAKDKGWWQDWDRGIPEQLALFHSEISEALEEYRLGTDVTEMMGECTVKGCDEDHCNHENKKPIGFPIELADLLIRIADTCGRYGIDLESALLHKMKYNDTRPMRHGGKKC